MLEIDEAAKLPISLDEDSWPSDFQTNRVLEPVPISTMQASLVMGLLVSISH
jgi:hypothetical protein